MFAIVIAFAVIAAIGGAMAGLVIGAAGALFYHTGFQFPVYFYGSLAIIAMSFVKHYIDRTDAKPQPVETEAFVEIPNPRTYRNGHLIFS